MLRCHLHFLKWLAEKNTSSCVKYLPFMCFFICVYLYLYLEVCGYLTAGVYCEAYARTGGRDLNICEQTAAHSSTWSTLGCIKQMAMEKSQVWAAGCRKLDAYYITIGFRLRTRGFTVLLKTDIFRLFDFCWDPVRNRRAWSAYMMRWDGWKVKVKVMQQS